MTFKKTAKTNPSGGETADPFCSLSHAPASSAPRPGRICAHGSGLVRRQCAEGGVMTARALIDWRCKH